MTHIGMKPLTSLQSSTLFVVAQNGPVTAADVDYHLLIDRSAAHGVLARLEKRGLVSATYTETRPGRRGRAFHVSDKGQALLDAENAEEDGP